MADIPTEVRRRRVEGLKLPLRGFTRQPRGAEATVRRKSSKVAAL